MEQKINLVIKKSLSSEVLASDLTFFYYSNKLQILKVPNEAFA